MKYNSPNGYYVRRVSLPVIDLCKDVGILVDVALKFHGHIRSIVGKSSGMSVNLLLNALTF